MKNNPESAQDTKVTIKWKRILKVRERLTQPRQIKDNSKGAQAYNVKIEWMRILKEHAILT